MFAGERENRSKRQDCRNPILIETMETRCMMSVTGVHVILPHHDQGPITETVATTAVSTPATPTSAGTVSSSAVHVILPHHDQGPVVQK